MSCYPMSCYPTVAHRTYPSSYPMSYRRAKQLSYHLSYQPAARQLSYGFTRYPISLWPSSCPISYPIRHVQAAILQLSYQLSFSFLRAAILPGATC